MAKNVIISWNILSNFTEERQTGLRNDTVYPGFNDAKGFLSQFLPILFHSKGRVESVWGKACSFTICTIPQRAMFMLGAWCQKFYLPYTSGLR